MADVEKSTVTEQHEQLDRVSTKEETASDDHKPLAPVDTLVPVDIHNSQAFKGDDSDGRIQWTIRKWFAAGFLAMLYTGEWLSLDLTQPSSNIVLHGRLSNPSLLHRWYIIIHSARYRQPGCDWLAPGGQHTSNCVCLSVRWLPSGSLRKAIYRPFRRCLPYHWMCCNGNSA